MTEYNLEDLFKPVIVTLGEHKYKLRERTKSLAPKLEAQEAKLNELADDASDAVTVPLVIETIDLVLEPLGDGRENGTRTHAKTFLKKEYDADRVGSDRLLALLRALQTEQFERLDPTSLPSSSSSSM